MQVLPTIHEDHAAIVPRDRSKEELVQSIIFSATQSSAPLAEIVGVSFGLLNPAHARANAVDIITKPTINSKGRPPFGSVNSPALGPINNYSVTHCCKIVGCRCMGGYAIAELAYPVYNPLFLDDYIVKILNCVCPWCSRLLVDESNTKLQLKLQSGLQRKDRIPFIMKLSKSINVCSLDPAAQRRKRKTPPKPPAPAEDDGAFTEEQLAELARAFAEYSSDEDDGSDDNEDEDEEDISDDDSENQPTLDMLHEENAEALELENAKRDELIKSGCCGGVQYHYFRRKKSPASRDLHIWREAKITSEDGEIIEGKKEMVSRATVLDIFKRMSDHDIDLLGLHVERGRPEFMLFEVFIIPSRMLRPVMSYQSGNQKSGDNPFNKKLQMIIKANEDAVKARCQLIRKCRSHRGSPATPISSAMTAWEGQDVATNKTRSTVTAVMRANRANKKLEQLKLTNMRRLELDETGKLQMQGSYRSGDPEIDDFTWENYIQDDLESYKDTQWLVEDLQYLINIYLSSADFPIPKHSKNNRSKATAANKINLENRVNGKQGLQRASLLPKKNDYSARAVIIPNPQLDVHELGVPLRIAKKITVPETVSPLNIEKMRELVRAGPQSYPGALYVQTTLQSEDYINLNYVDRLRYAEELEDGMIIHRNILDGDIDPFNRQPSLTENSFMSHVVRVIPGHAIQMNPAACKAYNADFDGDQMHIHISQTLGARVECRRLVQIKYCILTSQSSTPLVAPIQDTITACYQLTQHDIIMPEFEYRRYMAMAMYFQAKNVGRTPPALLVHRKKTPGKWTAYRTGRQLFSQLLPPTMNFIKDASYLPKLSNDASTFKFNKLANDWFSRAEDQQVVIVRGEMLRGIITSKELGTSPTSMIHHLVHNFGHEPTVRFESDLSRVTHEWLGDYGFSIGPEDFVLPEPGPVAELITRGLSAIANHPVLKPAIDPEARLEKGDDPIVARAREHATLDMLSQLTNVVGMVAKEQVKHWNSLLQIILAGAKGKEFNLVQILTMLGQTVVGGRRLVPSDDDITGTTAHVPKTGMKIAPEWSKLVSFNNLMSQGHIKSSYAKGLNPFEYYAHAKAGRQGIKVGALITADVGYLQRKMMYAMMNLTLQNDLSVRDPAGNMLQILYGKDGFDAKYLCRQQLGLIKMNDSQLLEAYGAIPYIKDILWPLERQSTDAIKTEEELVELLATEVWQLREFRNILRSIRMHHRSNKLNEEIAIPAQLLDIVQDAINKQNDGHFARSDIVLTPSLAITRIMACKERLYAYYPGFYNRLWAMEAALHSVLCIKNVICVYRLNYLALEYILCELEYRFKRALADPHTLVGCVAAQNLGQVQLQGAMNSHSSVGVGRDGGAAAGGFSLFQQCINTTENPKDPQMRLYPVEMRRVREFMSDQDIEHHLLRDNKLAHTSESDQQQAIADYISKLIVHRGLEYFLKRDPECVDIESAGDSDKEWIDISMALMDGEQLEHLKTKSRFSLRLVLDPHRCQKLQITPFHLLKAIKSHLKEPTATDDDVILRTVQDTYSIGLCSPTLEDGWVLRLFVDERVKYFSAFLKSKSINGDRPKAMQLFGHHLRDNVRVCGISGISHANIIQEKYKLVNPDDGSIIVKTEPVVVTRGINVLQTIGLPFVDESRSTANCLRQVCSVWGIEVAENMMMRSLEKLIDSGDYVDSRNLLQLVRTMCHRGYIMPLQRNGINKVSDSGAIHKSNFERQVENFCEAAASGERDPLKGATERCMMGLGIKAGTGAVDVELPDIDPSDEVIESHKSHIAAQVLPVFTEMDRNIMLYNSGEQRVYAPEHIDPEQLHHDMESNIMRFSSIGDHGIYARQEKDMVVGTAATAPPSQSDMYKQQFWDDVLAKRKAYTKALKERINLLKGRAGKGKRKRDETTTVPAAPKKRTKPNGLFFEFLSHTHSVPCVRPLDGRDKTVTDYLPLVFDFVNFTKK